MDHDMDRRSFLPWLLSPLVALLPGKARARDTNAAPTGGTFFCTYAGQTTAPLPWNATQEQVQAEVESFRPRYLRNASDAEISAVVDKMRESFSRDMRGEFPEWQP